MAENISDKIKRLTLTALVSDDYLLENLTLKGGNALTMIHKLNHRGSKDMDFSIEDDFSEDVEIVAERIRKTLFDTFKENGYIVIDFYFAPTPYKVSEDMKDFWGGYDINFKIVEESIYEKNLNNKEALSRNAIPVSENNSSKIEIDISKFEYVGQKERHEIDGLVVYVYAPILILFEKVRALCQQTQEYNPIVKRKRNNTKGRARDFYDIYSIMENVPGLDIFDDENEEILKKVFAAKRVPIEYINLIKNYKEVHGENFQSVRDTLNATDAVKDFNFYFEYTVNNFEKLLDKILKTPSGSTDATE